MRKLVGTLVVLVVVLIAADFVLRFVATRQIGDAVQAKLGLPEAPEVSISGFPFVTQAINGEYDAISAALPPTTFGTVANIAVNVDLLGVRIPLADAITGDTAALTAAGSQVRVTIPPASIAAAANLPSLQITRASEGLKIAAKVSALNQEFDVSADLQATLVDETLRLRAANLTGAGITLPPAAADAIGTLLDLSIPLGELPFTITHGSVNLVGTDLVVDATTAALDFADVQ